jgi:DNA modification methylase
LGRRWIGIEVEEEFCEIAKRRIEEELRMRKLF